MLAGGGAGKDDESPRDRLSVLIERLNDKFGVGMGEGDKLWVEQQKADIAADDEVRTVALNNDYSAFELVLRAALPKLVAARHAQNGKMFDLYFNDPRFQSMLIGYLGTAYEDFRAASL